MLLVMTEGRGRLKAIRYPSCRKERMSCHRVASLPVPFLCCVPVTMIHQFIACKELFGCKIFPSVSEQQEIIALHEAKVA